LTTTNLAFFKATKSSRNELFNKSPIRYHVLVFPYECIIKEKLIRINNVEKINEITLKSQYFNDLHKHTKAESVLSYEHMGKVNFCEKL